MFKPSQCALERNGRNNLFALDPIELNHFISTSLPHRLSGRTERLIMPAVVEFSRRIQN